MHSLLASWTQAGTSSWDLPAEFVEFVGITCYLDDAGWKHLSTQLTRQAWRNSGFAGLLVISRSGLLESASWSLPREIHAFVRDHQNRVAVHVVADRPGQLVHAKGWACRAHPLPQTWVGSANLTHAGLYGNAEAGARLLGEDSFVEFAAAVRNLTRYTRDLADGAFAEELTRLLRRRDEAPAPQRPSFPPETPPESPPLPGSPRAPIVEADALTAAVNWLAAGRRLARQHEGDSYAISYPLKRYIDAGLLRHDEAEDGRTGIRVAGKQKALYVPLLPRAWKDDLRELNQSLGRHLSRYTVEIAGILWCPRPLLPHLQSAWQAERRKLDLNALRDALAQHVNALQRTIQRDGDDWLNVSRLFTVEAPARWGPQARRILPDQDFEEARRHPERATEIVAAVILGELNKNIARQLNLPYLLALAQHIGLPPHDYPFDLRDPDSILDAILDLTLVGLEPLVRAGGHRKPRAHGLVADRLKNVCKLDFTSAQDAWTRAIELKSDQRNLAESWALFCRVFDLDQRPIDWEPSPTDIGLYDDDDG